MESIEEGMDIILNEGISIMINEIKKNIESNLDYLKKIDNEPLCYGNNMFLHDKTYLKMTLKIEKSRHKA